MPLTLQITDAGRAALVNAGHDGTNAVRVATVGVSPTAIVAGPGTAALPGELKRIATISGEAVAADVLHMVVRDESADSYTLRSFALYLEDGTLFAAYGQADPIIEKSVQSLLLLAIDVALTDVSADQVTFGDSDFLNPPATTETPGVVELATDAEALALVDKLRALTPAGLGNVFTAANILSRLLTVDGAGSGIDSDLLDGEDGSYYTNIVARLGYTPLDATAYTAGDVLAKLVTVDGSDSGIDSDLLDGRHASEFALLTGAQFTGPVELRTSEFPTLGLTRTGIGTWSVGGAGADSNDFAIRLNSINPALLLDSAGNASFSGAIYRAGNRVWDAGNDGSGSGSDSDMVDGHHASELALLSGATFTGPIFGTGISLSQGITAPLGFYLSATSYFGKPTPRLVDYTPDSGDTMRFDQDANQWDWYIDSNYKLSIRPTMVLISDALNVGGPLSAPNMMAETFATSTSLGRAYLQIISGNTASTGYIEFRRADNTREGYIGFVGTGAAMPFVCENGAGFAFNGGLIARDGNRVWDAGNDGAGSSSDSDMVDGWHRDQIRDWLNLLNKPATFPPSAHTHSAADIAAAFAGTLGPNGYIVLPGGLIFQWAAGSTMSAGTETTQFVAFPITFPSQCFRALASTNITASNIYGDALFQLVGSPGVNGATVMRQHVSSEADSVSSYPTIWAIGI